MPNNKAWHDLFNDFNLNFDYVGNFNDSFYTKKNHDIFLFTIFIQDLIDETEEENKLKKRIRLIETNLVNLIKNKLNKFNGPVIICLSNHIERNLIENLKNNNYLEKLSQNIKKKLANLKNNNLFVINLDAFFSLYGFNNIFNSRNLYLANMRLSLFGLEKMIYQVKSIINRIYYPAKKVLILDCDDTLWGGIIGEDGIENIQLGQDGYGKVFTDFQKSIKKISREGTILCVCSKNNLEDVMNVFENHKHMVLKKNDILSFKVNWKEKYINIKELADQLSLGLDSFVFWDDNPIERAKVRKFLPEVETIEPDNEIVNWPNQLKNLDFFSKFNLTKDDKKKLKQYRIRSKFVDDKNNAKEELLYLKSIKLKAKILKISSSNLMRASQLTMKTNQFNLRTIRYTQNDIVQLNKVSKNLVFLISLKDVYGDHGIVSLVIVKYIKNNNYFLDTFLMSCRVLGRKLETWILRELFKKLNKNKCEKLYAEFVPSSKNDLVSKLLVNHGFSLIEKKNLNFYSKNKSKCFEIITKNNNVKFNEAKIYG